MIGQAINISNLLNGAKFEMLDTEEAIKNNISDYELYKQQFAELNEVENTSILKRENING